MDVGGLQERFAPDDGRVFEERVLMAKHDNPHSSPAPFAPPNMETALIVLSIQHPSHSYMVSLPDTTIGILPISDANFILEIYPPLFPITFIPVLMYHVPAELYGGTALI